MQTEQAYIEELELTEEVLNEMEKEYRDEDLRSKILGVFIFSDKEYLSFRLVESIIVEGNISIIPSFYRVMSKLVNEKMLKGIDPLKDQTFHHKLVYCLC